MPRNGRMNRIKSMCRIHAILSKPLKKRLIPICNSFGVTPYTERIDKSCTMDDVIRAGGREPSQLFLTAGK